MSDGTDDDGLRQRVDQLEDRIESQQDTIERLMPSRRSVVAGALGLGAFGAGTRYGSQRASAQAAGQVGTDADPVDAELWDLNVQNGVTSDLPMNGNAVTGVGALETEQTDVGEIPSDPDNPKVHLTSTNGDIQQTSVTTTVDGDNTQTDIYAIGSKTALLVVFGRSSGTDVFLDLVPTGVNRVGDAIKNDLRESPGTRVYSESQAACVLAIDDSGETYDVKVQTIGGTLP